MSGGGAGGSGETGVINNGLTEIFFPRYLILKLYVNDTLLEQPISG